MVSLSLAHVGAGGGLGQGDTPSGEGFNQSSHRCAAAEIHHCARPVKDHQIEGLKTAFHHDTNSPIKSATTSSPSARPTDAPAPVVTITSRTPGIGVSITTLRLWAEA
jgi:hypothetical protein